MSDIDKLACKIALDDATVKIVVAITCRDSYAAQVLYDEFTQRLNDDGSIVLELGAVSAVAVPLPP